MSRLGPFEPAPRIAVALSGGADSSCLCILADAWCRTRHGVLSALIVDHRARPESAHEAAQTAARFEARGVSTRILALHDIPQGAAFAARARAARFAALEGACREAHILHLLIGHHAADQAETRLIRMQSRSGVAGLAGISAVRETRGIRILRPLLGADPARLRTTLRRHGIDWLEDPSNTDPSRTRARLRPEAALQRGMLLGAMGADAAWRVDVEAQAARELAAVTLRPEGFVVVAPGRLIGRAAWSAIIQTVTGAPYPPASAPIRRLAHAPYPCTISGARVLAGGRLGAWAVAREAASLAPGIPARHGALWDGRFRVIGDAPGLTVSALAEDTASVRHRAPWPAAILSTLPALRRGRALIAVPHLGIGDAPVAFRFEPSQPAACAGFLAA